MPARKSIPVLFPVFCNAAFILVYVVATCYYPGGSQADKYSKGFSWQHNYWCNLMSETAINGAYNHARPIALVAMAILYCSLSVFWIQFFQFTCQNKIYRRLYQLCGVGAMSVSLFMYTGAHDLFMNIAGLFGIIALFGTYRMLFKLRLFGLFIFGLVNLLLFGVNSYIYYVSTQLYYLPLIQKITFFTFLLWVSIVTVIVTRPVRVDASLKSGR